MRLLFLTGLLNCAVISCTGAAPTETARPQYCLNHARLISSQITCSTSQTEDLVFSALNPLSGPLLIEKTASNFNLFYPWSYEPFCTPVLEEIGTPLCVYTDNSFSHGRGISIFTTAKIASEFLSLLAFKNQNENQDASSNSKDDAHAETKINRNANTWITRSIPRKGMGMLAARDLVRGDLITAYTPVFIAFPEHSLSTVDRERFWRRAVDQLPVKSRELYLGLTTIFGDERFKAQDVLKANTFEVQLGGLMHLAVWPETARVNHECGPNSQYRIDHTQLVHYVHAARPISKGDEITITYRQAALQETFHFTCTCPRCTTSITSDAALTQISTLQTLLNDWSTTSDSDSPNSKSKATPKTAETLISLYKSEGLHGFLDMPYGHATLAYSAVGDAEGVKKYAGLAREAVGLKDGEGRGDWGLWKGLGREPRGHWSWRRRI